MVLFNTIMSNKLINLVVMATSYSSAVFLVFTAMFLWLSLPNWVREAAKISAGGVEPLQPNLHYELQVLVQTTVTKILE